MDGARPAVSLVIRHAEPRDHARVAGVVDAWWGGRTMRDMLPRLFFVHFRDTSFVAERGNDLVGFLCGFLSQTFDDEAYVHFVGVHPEQRGHGLGRALYEEFFEAARRRGRSVVRCITSPINRGSIAFHTRLGFAIVPGDGVVDGVAVHRDHDGRRGDRVLFVKAL